MEKKFYISMGEFKVSKGDTILESLGVGSCVAVCLYDSKNKIGGMAHIMLPQASKNISSNNMSAEQILDEMIKGLHAKGCKNLDLTAKIIGGASMYEFLKNRVGVKNILAVKDKLMNEKIPTIAEDIFGNQGRNIWFNLNDGKVVVAKSFSGTIEI
jgi:chemotaxis protein CheD